MCDVQTELWSKYARRLVGKLRQNNPMARHDFNQPVKNELAKRVAYRCSNPRCRLLTTGPHSESTRSVNVGVASHITAASAGGPRFDDQLSQEERSSIDNPIWLCQSCAKLIDNDETRYSVETISGWKKASEERINRELTGIPEEEFFPQPASAAHTPIPRISGCTDLPKTTLAGKLAPLKS